MKNINRHYFSDLILLLLVILYGTNCDNTFEPMQENDRYAFSLYGTLDIHADTQWVRVMPIGETLIPTDTIPPDATVMITRERTGTTAALKDSLFRFGGIAYALNYRTTETIHPNEEYILTATAPAGRQSISFVTTPSFLPYPEIDYNTQDEQGIVTGRSEEPIVIANMLYDVIVCSSGTCSAKQEVVIHHLSEVITDAEGNYHFSINDLNAIAMELHVNVSEINISKRELHIVTGSADWPNLSDLIREEMFLPDAVTNVEGGTGFVAGIASRKIVIIEERMPPPE